MKNTVAIVGRPNVGKSTLFNRLVGGRKAIVDDVSGVTRDRQYDYTDWNGFEFLVVDTGGYVNNSDDIFEVEIKKQVEFAIEESQLILFVVDVTVGIADLDEAFAKYLRRIKKPVFVVVNKVDNNERIPDSYEFYKLGFDQIYPLSSINGTGTGELLDDIVNSLDKGDGSIEELPDLPKISVIGKPNVGKSTYVNALLEQERHIVSDIPGTTRDSIHTIYNKYGKEFIIIDTAGLRKKSKVFDNIEFYSNIRAIKAIEDSNVCLLLIDANEGIQSQDLHILSVVEKRNKGVVILLNKWDSIEKDSNSEKRYIDNLKDRLGSFNDIPIVTISAKDKTRILKSLEVSMQVVENIKRKIPTSKLNQEILPLIEAYPPPSVKGKFIRIKFITQIPASYPLFAFFCSNPQYVKDSYRKYLENKIREKFEFSGVPIKISFRLK